MWRAGRSVGLEEGVAETEVDAEVTETPKDEIWLCVWTSLPWRM